MVSTPHSSRRSIKKSLTVAVNGPVLSMDPSLRTGAGTARVPMGTVAAGRESNPVCCTTAGTIREDHRGVVGVPGHRKKVREARGSLSFRRYTRGTHGRNRLAFDVGRFDSRSAGYGSVT
jgi:hypothetical protein